MTVVSKTRGRCRGRSGGRGSGCLFSFQNVFVAIFAVTLLSCYFRMIGMCPSFMVEICKDKRKETTEAL